MIRFVFLLGYCFADLSRTSLAFAARFVKTSTSYLLRKNLVDFIFSH
jgi:hypothetical protein